jgi:hypothetical protein
VLHRHDIPFYAIITILGQLLGTIGGFEHALGMRRVASPEGISRASEELPGAEGEKLDRESTREVTSCPANRLGRGAATCALGSPPPVRGAVLECPGEFARDTPNAPSSIRLTILLRASPWRPCADFRMEPCA